jgi:hypothetical protein
MNIAAALLGALGLFLAIYAAAKADLEAVGRHALLGILGLAIVIAGVWLI